MKRYIKASSGKPTLDHLQVVWSELENGSGLLYSVRTDDGEILFEEVLFGKKNRALNAKSLIIKKGRITEESLRNILASNAKNDITNMKIRYADAVVAKSTIHSV